MFKYTSVQSYSNFVNGKLKKKIQTVKINGNKGYKAVSVIKNGRRSMSKKHLTRKEMTCIKRCQFIPGLFKDCQSCV